MSNLTNDFSDSIAIDIDLALPDPNARGAFLSSTRSEMYNALSLFHTHVKYTISLMFTLLGMVFTFFGIAARGEVKQPEFLFLFKIIGITILWLLVPLGIISIIIIARYYKLYTAAIVYAADLHKLAHLNNHAWFADVEELRMSLGENASTEKIILKRTYGWPHSWILYAIIIGCLSIAGLIIGALVAALL